MMVGIESCAGSYQRGCRCQTCRDTMAAAARWRRRRKLYGIETPTDLIPAAPSREALLRMRASGASWGKIADLVASDRRSMQRIGTGERTSVTRNMADRITGVEVWFSKDPRGAAAVGTKFVDPTMSRWMVGALLARGWSAQWVGEQLGHNKMVANDLRSPTMLISTATDLGAVFAVYHDTWGPSRVGARRMWRKGVLPSECYDWEQAVPDLRIIPGSLDAALVLEAATFKNPDQRKTALVLKSMAGWGQWPDDRCARSAMRFWCEATGRHSPEDHLGKRDGVWCWDRSHHHTALPAAWR